MSAAPHSAASPARSQTTAPSLPLTYSMDDSDPTVARRSSPPSSGSSALPPAYALERTERAPASQRGSSFGGETTEDSLLSMDRSVDQTEYSTTSGGGYEGLQQRRQKEMGGDAATDLERLYERAALQDLSSPVEEYPSSNDGAYGGDDATSTIHQMHKKLLHLLSSPELFHDALDWQAQLDRGIDPSVPAGAGKSLSENTKDANVSALTHTFETEFEDDSTFRGLQDDDDEDKAKAVTHSENETFEFNPNDGKKDGKKEEKEEDGPKPKEPPLPHQIFASDAEVVLPQALTASQLFGIERMTGIELEAAAGMTGLCQLFLRWLALMPEGDHVNVIDPPGLTVMKIAGGGYRVTGAHRVVWRWMNKFSPASTGQSASDTDFDFGDLVTMTIIDVFETDVTGKLLSYCPTFDNRAVHKTPETIERLRKGATQLMETMEVVSRSPAAKSARTYARTGFRAALVVGHAVKNKIQHQAQYQSAEAEATAEGEDLNELLQSQIASDESEAEGNAVDATALEEDPTSSPRRRMV